ncbi:MAG: hypothetical protein E7376_02095 [Clostridiales bacterium]|nr:hypothetical protein [Clostridiales bacterium]
MINSLMLFNIGKYLGGIFSIIPKMLYFIVSAILSLIDLCQVSFRKMAGLDPIIIDGEPYIGDSVYKLITDALFGGKYPAVKTVFWAIIILGIAMLFITSLIAVIRLEYNPDKEKGNSKAGVIKNFFKALFSFAIVPIACLFGMFLANSLVGIIDSATAQVTTPSTDVVKYYDKWSASDSNQDSIFADNANLNARDSSYMAYNIFGLSIPTTSEPFSGIVFRACAYGSNRIRNNNDFYLLAQNKQILGFMDQIDKQEDAANLIDTGFAINAKLKGTFNLPKDDFDSFFFDCSEWIDFGVWKYTGITELSKYNVDAVYFFYNLWSFNYIIAFVAVLSIGKMFFNFVLYLMQRMFEILGLFLISPIAIGLMPLDGGDALKNWRTQFVIKFALLIIMVLSFNLITPLISIAQNIKFFGVAIIDYIVQTFFLVAAFNSISALQSILTKIFTGDEKNFNQVGAAAQGIQSSFNAGLGAAASTAKFATKISPVGIGAWATGKAAKAAFNAPAKSKAKNEALERKEVQDQIKFGNKADGDFTDADITSKWGGLAGAGAGGNKNDARGLNTVNDFLGTSEGQDFINKYYGGNKTKAQRALRGTHGQDVTDVDAMRQYESYLHDKEQFDKSSEAAKHGVGTSAYWAELEKYRQSSFDEKTDYFTGSNAGLTARQNQLKAKIATADRWDKSWGRQSVRWVGKTAGKAAPVVKKVGAAGGKMLKPIGGLLSTLPFTELIGNSFSAIFGTKPKP